MLICQEAQTVESFAKEANHTDAARMHNEIVVLGQKYRRMKGNYKKLIIIELLLLLCVTICFIARTIYDIQFYMQGRVYTDAMYIKLEDP